MLKRLCIAISAFACIALAQTTTPNVGLQLPAHGATNWDSALNTNFSTLDSLLGGQSVIPDLSVQTMTIGSTATQPSCSVTNRGQLWFVPGISGATDQFQQCMSISGSYSWTTLGTGGSTGSPVVQFAPSYTSTSITFGNCSGASPCYLAPNGILETYGSAPIVSASAGTAADLLWIYGIPTSNIIQVGYNSANTYTCNSGGCALVSGITGIPMNAYGLYKCVVTGGAPVNSGCTPVSTQFTNSSLGAGLGVTAVKDPTTGAITLNNNRTTRYVTSGTTDTITGSDGGHSVSYSSSSNVTASVPAPSLGGQFNAGIDLWIFNYGTGTVTLNFSSAYLNGTASSSPVGATSLVIPAGTPGSPNAAYLVSDGSNYTGGLFGPGAGSGAFNGGTVTTPVIVNSATQPQFSAQGGGAAGYNIYDITADTFRFQIGVGGSSSSLANEFYFYDKTNGAKRMHIDSTGLTKVDSARFGIVATSTAPPCSATGDIGNFWMNNTTSTTAAEWCGATSGTVAWESFGSGSTGSGSVSSGAYSALPGTCTTGAIYVITSGYFDRAICTSTNTWTFYDSKGMAITPAESISGGLTNGGNTGASITNSNSNGYDLLTVSASGANDFFRTFAYTYPGSGTYTKNFVFVPPIFNNTNNYQLFDVVVGDASTGFQGVTCGVGNANISGEDWCESVKYTTAGVGSYDTSTGASFNQGMEANAAYEKLLPFNIIQFQDDGTNFYFYICRDPNVCTKLYQVSRTSFLAGSPTKLGFGIRNSTSSNTFSMVFVGVQ